MLVMAQYASEIPAFELYDLTFIDIAASAYGREYLSSCVEGKEYIKNMCSVLATAPLSEEW